MFKTLINAFKVQDIRRRLLYTFFILVVVRLGSLITVPGISADAIREYMQNALGDSLNIFSSFTGGSFEQMSIFALSVTPYITASIIIQLLTITICNNRKSLPLIYRLWKNCRKTEKMVERRSPLSQDI